MRAIRTSGAFMGFWLARCAARPREMIIGPLQDPLAHEDLEARRTTGTLLLDPAS